MGSNYKSLLLLLFILLLSSCEKEDVHVFTIEGYITDEITSQAVAGVVVKVDAIKSSSGMGIITDGKRESAGQATTDDTGYYRVKLKVFKEAVNLELFLNNDFKDGYSYKTDILWLRALDTKGNNNINFNLNRTAILKVKFKNTKPVSDSDVFKLTYYGFGTGKVEIKNRESCGTVTEGEHFQWVGKDVCGIYIIEAIAGYESTLNWVVTKNNETTHYNAKIFVERGVINEYFINY